MFVRLTADASGMRTGTKEAEIAMDRFAGVAKKLGGALAAAFTVKKVAEFGTDVVKTFAEAEAVWARLGGAIEATGQSFDSLRPQIEGAAAAMQKVTRFGDEDFAAALQNLVVQTGDVQQSMALMGLAADLAAAQQIDLSSATELLGRALAGNATSLTRMFPALKESTDLFGDLQQIVQGMATKDAATLEGRLDQLNNAWGDFKEAIGGALTGATNMGGAVFKLTGFVQDLTKLVDENAASFRALGGLIELSAQALILYIKPLGLLGGLLSRVGDLWDRIRGKLPTVSVSIGEVEPFPAPVPRIPVVDVTTAAKSVASINRVADAWTDFASAYRVAQNVFDEFGDAQQLFQTQLRAAESAFEEFLRLGVDPASDGVRALVEEIEKLGLLLEGLPNRVPSLPEIPVTVRVITQRPELPEPTLFESAAAKVGDVFRDLGPAVIAPFKSLGSAIQGLLGSLLPWQLLLDALHEAFGDLLRNVAPIVSALATALAPVLKAMFPVIKLMAIAFTYVGQVFFTVAGALQVAIGSLVKGLGKFLDALPFVGDFGLIKAGQSIIDMGKASFETVGALGQARKEIEALEWQDALNPLKEAANQTAQALRNVPEGFKVALARFNATEGVGAVPGGAGGGGPAAAAAGSGFTLTIMGDLNVAAPNPEEFERQLRQRARRGGAFATVLGF